MNISDLIQNLFRLLRNTFNPLFAAVLAFINPVVSIAAGLVSIVGFLLGALANPQGWMNGVVISIIDTAAAVLPSTPESLKIGTILGNITQTLPQFGSAIIADIFESLTIILGLVAVIKIYKLIPFKAT